MTFKTLAPALLAGAALIAAPAHAQPALNRLPQIYTMTPSGVNLQSGTFVTSNTDFTIGALGFERSWRAQPQLGSYDDQSFGGWNHNYMFLMGFPGSNGAAVYADGKVYQFTLGGSGWVPSNIDQYNNNALGAELTGSGVGTMTFRNQAGDVVTLTGCNRPAGCYAQNVVRADGTRLDFSYDGSNRVRTVLSNRGDAIVIDYGGNGKIAAACGYNRATTFVDASTTCAAAPIRVTYGYTSIPNQPYTALTSVTDLDGRVTTMSYDGATPANLTCMTLPNSATCRFTNSYGPQPGEPLSFTEPHQVRRQVMATGEIWQYRYFNNNLYLELPPLPGEIRYSSATMTDPEGGVTIGAYENGLLAQLTAPSGVTHYSWNGLRPTDFTHPGGNVETLTHDERGNVLTHVRQAAPGSGLASIQTSATFPATAYLSGFVGPIGCVAASQRVCDKPLTTTDERGNVTDYTYDPAHGGVLTETRPAPTSGAVRPQTRYSYSQVHAGVRNSGGTIVAAPTPVWVLTQESRCQTLASCTGGADEVRTLYEYGPSGSADALRLRGTVVTGGGVTARTCYGYDPTGNRISETGPGAGLASCP